MSVATVITKLARIDTLPGTLVELPIGDWNVDAHTGNDALGVCGHIVRAFKNMSIVRHVFRYETVVNSLHVSFPSFLLILFLLNNMPLEAEERLIGYLVLK